MSPWSEGSGRRRLPVAVLGATGAVGQTFVRLLHAHPWFELAEVAASQRSEGLQYADAARWIEGEMPESAARLTVLPCDPAAVKSPLVFSALDSSVASEVESAFAAAGRMVLSNARNHRMDPDVPLVIPEVNPDHFALLTGQRKGRGWSGGIVTNANCAATVMALALAPLHERHGVRRVFAATMQAVSGAGYPGVPSLDIMGNVIPYIADEEPKIEAELLKLLGRYEDDAIVAAPITVAAHANRVPVEHGHTVCMSVELEERCTPAEAMELIGAWRGYAGRLNSPTAPERPLLLTNDAARPQPRRDVFAGRGMSVLVGRVREDPIFHLRLVALGHNTIRGAAGGSVLNAECLALRGEIARA